MIDFGNFYQLIAKNERLSHWLETLPAQIAKWNKESLHGYYPGWVKTIENLPDMTPDILDLKTGVTAQRTLPLTDGETRRINNILRNLMPWRKGPFSLYGVEIDTEWRSDLKWDRVLPHLSPLAGRTILDVGCGSGYHMWRMAGEGAEQCGFCSPGFIMNVLAMKRELSNPDDREIREYLAGNLCRCTGYAGQMRAVRKYLEAVGRQEAEKQETEKQEAQKS